MVQIKVIGHSNNQKTFLWLKRSLLLMGITLAILLTACRSDQMDLGTSTIGEITLYTTLEKELAERYLAAFNDEYPNIKVNYERHTTGVIIDRLIKEKENPQADVIWSLATSSILIAEWKEILKAYMPEDLSKVDEPFRDSANPPNWVGMYVWMSAFCVNMELIEERGLPIPKSWQDLLDPVYKEQIVMPNPDSARAGFLVVSSFLEINGEAKGWENLDKLHSNIAEYSDSDSESCKLAGEGKYPIGISWGLQGIMEKEKSQPVTVIFPSEGSGWELEASALVKKKQIKPATKTFFNWAISEKAMKIYAQDWAVTTVETDQPVPEGFPSDPRAQLIDSDLPWTAANREAILSEWVDRYDNQ